MRRAMAPILPAIALSLALGFAPTAAADNGQSVRTQSGKVRCEVYTDDTAHGGGPLVVCQTADGGPFPQSPVSAESHEPMNLAVVRANGAFNWMVGNIGGSREAMDQDIVLMYGQTFHVNGWTIEPSFDGTRFTNDATGHGMFVSIDDVNSF